MSTYVSFVRKYRSVGLSSLKVDGVFYCGLGNPGGTKMDNCEIRHYNWNIEERKMTPVDM